MKEKKENNPDQKENKDSESQYLPVQFIESSSVEDEIDLIELIHILWRAKKIIGIITLVFLFVGIFHYNTEPEEYVSEAILVKERPQLDNANIGLFRQFAFATGGNQEELMGTGFAASIIDIAESVDFQRRLILEEVYFSNRDSTISLAHYFENYYEPPFRTRFYKTIIDYSILLPITLYRHINSLYKNVGQFFQSKQNSDTSGQIWGNQSITEEDRILYVSPQMLQYINQMKSRVNIESDGSLITSTVRLTDPHAAAEANHIVIQMLQEYLINQRAESARRNLEYAMTLNEEAKDRFENAQTELARFLDENRGSLTAATNIELERLSEEKERLLSVYTNISMRVDDARMRVQEETPAYILFQRPLLPNNRVQPSIFIIPAFIFTGFVIGVMWVFTSSFIGLVKSRIDSY